MRQRQPALDPAGVIQDPALIVIMPARLRALAVCAMSDLVRVPTQIAPVATARHQLAHYIAAIPSLAMAAPLPLRFVRSASAHTQLEDSVSEIALVGRSNVGKSSLINAVANRHKLAKTSKTPGATQLLNIYEYGEEDSGRWLVDLPGYGYAKLPKHKQKEMATMINDYMVEREQLTHAVVLVDANVGATDLDVQTIDWLRHIELDFSVVGTKVDKIKSGERSKKQKKTATKLQMTSGDIHWCSAEKGTGIPEVRALIGSLLFDD